MAEEQKESQSGASQAEDTQKEQKEDYEAKYKEMQAKYEKALEEGKANTELLATLSETPGAINWNVVSGQAAGNEQTEDTGEYVDKKTMQKSMEQAINTIKADSNNKIMALQFKVDHPELKAYEHTLVVPTLMRLQRQHPRTSVNKLLDMAAKEVSNFLEAEREKGRTEAEKKKKEREDEVEKASGLGSRSDTAPENVGAGESKQEWVDSRKKRLEKMKTPSGVSS